MVQRLGGNCELPLAAPSEAAAEGGALPGSQVRFLLFCHVQGTQGTDTTAVDDEAMKGATCTEVATSERGPSHTPLLTGAAPGTSLSLACLSIISRTHSSPTLSSPCSRTTKQLRGYGGDEMLGM